MLGKRNKEIYGSLTLTDIYEKLTQKYEQIHFTFYQSNYEGEIIDLIHNTFTDNYDAIIINPGALTHQSIALRDALEIIEITKIEVHLSNIFEREDFRKVDYIKDVCHQTFMGKKLESYFDAIDYLLSKNTQKD